MQEAIRKLTKLPATNLKIQKRGELKVGNYADVVIFDPEKVKDNAIFEKPHQYAEGVLHVFVNGTPVIEWRTYRRHARKICKRTGVQEAIGNRQLVNRENER